MPQRRFEPCGLRRHTHIAHLSATTSAEKNRGLLMDLRLVRHLLRMVFLTRCSTKNKFQGRIEVDDPKSTETAMLQSGHTWRPAGPWSGQILGTISLLERAKHRTILQPCPKDRPMEVAQILCTSSHRYFHIILTSCSWCCLRLRCTHKIPSYIHMKLRDIENSSQRCRNYPDANHVK